MQTYIAMPHEDLADLLSCFCPYLGKNHLTLAGTAAYLVQQLGVYDLCEDLDGMIDCCDDAPPWLLDERGVRVGL